MFISILLRDKIVFTVTQLSRKKKKKNSKPVNGKGQESELLQKTKLLKSSNRSGAVFSSYYMALSHEDWELQNSRI